SPTFTNRNVQPRRRHRSISASCQRFGVSLSSARMRNLNSSIEMSFILDQYWRTFSTVAFLSPSTEYGIKSESHSRIVLRRILRTTLLIGSNAQLLPLPFMRPE